MKMNHNLLLLFMGKQCWEFFHELGFLWTHHGIFLLENKRIDLIIVIYSINSSLKKKLK